MINGKATNALQPVTCNQTGQAWTIKTVDKEPGFTATIQLGDEVKAQTVEIRNLGNFTGTYWDDNLGKAQAKVSAGQVQRQRRGAGGVRRQTQPEHHGDVRHHHRLLTRGVLEGRAPHRRRAS